MPVVNSKSCLQNSDLIVAALRVNPETKKSGQLVNPESQQQESAQGVSPGSRLRVSPWECHSIESSQRVSLQSQPTESAYRVNPQNQPRESVWKVRPTRVKSAPRETAQRFSPEIQSSENQPRESAPRESAQKTVCHKASQI